MEEPAHVSAGQSWAGSGRLSLPAPHCVCLQDNLTETDLATGDILLDTSSSGPQALIIEPHSLNINKEDSQVFPATAFPKKVSKESPCLFYV